MGLDMFLSKEVYVGGQYEHRRVSMDDTKFTVGNRKVIIPANTIESISIEVGYWRKANQIHQWFVDNVQDGIDECQRVQVSKIQLLELKELCEEVLDDHSLAEDLLPVQGGLFFGNTEYDEYYFSDLEDTVKLLSELDLREAPADFDWKKAHEDGEYPFEYEVVYYYQSSW